MIRGASNLDITNPAFRLITDEAMRVIPAAEGSFIEVLDRGELVCTTGSGTLSYFAGLRLKVDASLSGVAVRTGSTVRCNDAKTELLVDREAALHVGAISFVCVPIRREGETVGALVVSSSKLGAFNDRDEMVLTGFAASLFPRVA